MKKHEVPILLLTGYLGSGKTTLVNHILSNRKGIKFAVIVNDIGEVNIDADLIARGGVVGKKDDSLVALQNGCICCTLKMDLVEQVCDLLKMGQFDYIVIEASGICEPAPIAQTLCSIQDLGEPYTRYGVCRLDCVTTVVDVLRLQSEFAGGNDLKKKDVDEEDIVNLLIQQIEFCNIVLLNKASEISSTELAHIKEIVRSLQPGAEIIACDYANVDLDKLIHTGSFDFNKVIASMGWVRAIEHGEEEDHDEDHDHHHDGDHHHDEENHDDHDHEQGHNHHHHHHHDEGEAEEYGIQTFVYYRRRPFDIHKLDRFIYTQWPSNVIRTKGICYFSNNKDMSCVFEQAGIQKKLTQSGLWYAAAPQEDLLRLLQQEPDLLKDWDPVYGDRMQKIVFIGQNLDKRLLAAQLDECLD